VDGRRELERRSEPSHDGTSHAANAEQGVKGGHHRLAERLLDHNRLRIHGHVHGGCGPSEHKQRRPQQNGFRDNRRQWKNKTEGERGEPGDGATLEAADQARRERHTAKRTGGREQQSESEAAGRKAELLLHRRDAGKPVRHDDAVEQEDGAHSPARTRRPVHTSSGGRW
jgi:hypothetical protein